MALALLNIASTAAFGAFIALASLGLFSSYLIAIGCMLYARLSKEGVQYGEWKLGRWGVPVNIFAMVYSAYIAIFLPFPSTLPVTGANMNYALPIFAFSVVLPIFTWFFWARKHWKGLDADIVAVVLAECDMEMK
jgi:amino acid transporter